MDPNESLAYKPYSQLHTSSLVTMPGPMLWTIQVDENDQVAPDFRARGQTCRTKHTEHAKVNFMGWLASSLMGIIPYKTPPVDRLSSKVSIAGYGAASVAFHQASHAWLRLHLCI
jgi:hypothetical protein